MRWPGGNGGLVSGPAPRTCPVAWAARPAHGSSTFSGPHFLAPKALGPGGLGASGAGVWGSLHCVTWNSSGPGAQSRAFCSQSPRPLSLSSLGAILVCFEKSLACERTVLCLNRLGPRAFPTPTPQWKCLPAGQEEGAPGYIHQEQITTAFWGGKCSNVPDTCSGYCGHCLRCPEWHLCPPPAVIQGPCGRCAGTVAPSLKPSLPRT